jgi:hypothetical protein
VKNPAFDYISLSEEGLFNLQKYAPDGVELARAFCWAV